MVLLGPHRHMRVLMLLLYSFWVPQILYCARTEARQPLWAPFVVGMTLSRLALPLYLFGCPHNLLDWDPNYGLCVLLVLYMGAQVRGAKQAMRAGGLSGAEQLRASVLLLTCHVALIDMCQWVLAARLACSAADEQNVCCD